MFLCVVASGKESLNAGSGVFFDGFRRSRSFAVKKEDLADLLRGINRQKTGFTGVQAQVPQRVFEGRARQASTCTWQDLFLSALHPSRVF